MRFGLPGLGSWARLASIRACQSGTISFAVGGRPRRVSVTEAATLQKLSPALTTHSVGPPGGTGVTVGAGAGGAVVVVGASVVVVGGAVVVGPAVVGGAAVVGSTVVGGAVVVVVDSVVSGPITDAGPPAVVVVKRKGVVVDSSTC